MDYDDLKKRQYEQAMKLAEQGYEPDDVMLLSEGEYAQSIPRGYEGEGEVTFDLNKGDTQGFPVILIGQEAPLSEVDMKMSSFANVYAQHPVATYIKATMQCITTASEEDLSLVMLESQKKIYSVLFEIVTAALANYEEDLEYEKKALDNPNLNYLDRREYENDVKVCERIVASVKDMERDLQKALDTVQGLIDEANITRG